MDRVQDVTLLGDKGFLGAEWQAQMLAQTGNQFIAAKSKKQKIQHSDGFECLLNSVRQRIESVFHELQNCAGFSYTRHC